MKETINIRDFYKNKNIFVTGGTGFLGRVIVEKLLRVCDVNTIGLLIRAKNGIDPKTRHEQYPNHQAFNNLRTLKPDVFKKLSLIQGDIEMDDLNMIETDRKTIIEDYHIVIHCAANGRFDMNLKTAIQHNLTGTNFIIKLAKEMKNLMVFVYVSTAFSQSNQEILEERYYEATNSPFLLMRVAQGLEDCVMDSLTPMLLKKFPNTYTYSKCMAEELVHSYKDEVPIVIVRPSIITSSAQEPEPGYIDGLQNVVGLSLGVGIGVVRTAHMNTHIPFEFVPVDFAANAILASIWKRAKMHKNEIFYCNISNFRKNSITWSDFITNYQAIKMKYPMPKTFWYPIFLPTKYYINYVIYSILLHYIPAMIVDLMMIIQRKKPFLLKIYWKVIANRNSQTKHFRFRQYKFSDKNLTALQDELNDVEKQLFNFDLNKDHVNYMRTFVLGVRKFIMKGATDTLSQDRKYIKNLYYCHILLTTAFVFMFFLILYLTYFY